MLAGECAHPTLLGLIAGSGVYRRLGKSAHPPAHLKENVAGEGLLGVLVNLPLDCLPGLRPGISFDVCEKVVAREKTV